MGIIKDLNPHNGEIVNIKFKSLNDIMDNSKEDFHETEETYSISENTKAYLAGGHFIVEEAYDPEEDEKECINIINHLDCNYEMTVYNEVIESMEIITESDKFVSKEHKILVVRVDDEMFINGQPLIWNEAQKEREFLHEQKAGDYAVYENPNRKLLKLFENYIADMALKESLSMGDKL